nr:reverse transcriptase domain-containing protein [Tanacetum cinerariifolium]
MWRNSESHINNELYVGYKKGNPNEKINEKLAGTILTLILSRLVLPLDDLILKLLLIGGSGVHVLTDVRDILDGSSVGCSKTLGKDFADLRSKGVDAHVASGGHRNPEDEKVDEGIDFDNMRDTGNTCSDSSYGKLIDEEGDECGNLVKFFLSAFDLANYLFSDFFFKAIYTLSQAIYTIGQANCTLGQTIHILGQANYTLGQAIYTLDQANYTLGQANYTLGQAIYTHSNSHQHYPEERKVHFQVLIDFGATFSTSLKGINCVLKNLLKIRMLVWEETDSEISPKISLRRKLFKTCCMNWEEVKQSHAYYNGSRSSKVTEDPSWSTEVHARLDFGESSRERRTREDSHYSSARARTTKLERLIVRDRLRYGDRHVLYRLGYRRQSAFDRLSDTYLPSTTKSRPRGTNSMDHPRGRSRPHRLDTSNEDCPKDRERFRGVGESYDDSFSHSYRDGNRSLHMKRRRDNESPLSSVSKSDSSDGRVWFDELPPESVDSYKDLKAAFLAYFMQQKKYVKDPVEIHNIKQKDGETIEDFMERFKVETGSMKGPLNTMEEMMITTTAFIRGEAAAASKKKGHTSWKAQDRQKGKLQKKGLTSGVTQGKEGDLTGSPSYKDAKRDSYGRGGLLVTIGDDDHSTREWINFMIVRSLPPYNSIIGRPVIREIQAVPSTAHGMIKFPVEGGIVTIRSTILIPAECISVITSSVVPKEEGIRPENFKFALHPDFPDQEVAIGGTLSAKGHTEPCSILKKNLDIFSWQPSDMIGVPRSVAEHRLNIREGYSPVRQKKRGQAPERAKAIQTEVQKLVEVGIMREVYYHDWLSNTVMMQLAEPDEEKTTFHTGQRVYCYTKMPFCLKNAGATYQRLVDKAFDSQIGRNIEVYVDDLVVKSYTEAEMLRDIDETFRTLRKINRKLNPKKCTFEAAEGVFLGYVVTPEGIKPCPDKTVTVLQLPSPRTIKEVQSLNGKLASLNRFLSKSAEKSLPLFKTLKNCIKRDFHWTAEAEQAFKQLERHLSELPLLVAPKPKEELIIYLSATYGAISAALMTERGATQTPIYFISRALQGPKLNYTPMEKLVLSLVFAAKRLQRYFQAHPITVITNQPIKQIMSLKGQILADFLTEMPDENPPAAPVAETQQEPWTLFTDGSSCVDGSGAGLILTNPEGIEFTYALRFQFAASNNELRGKKALHQGPTVRIIRGNSLQAVVPYAVVKMCGTALGGPLIPITAPWPFYKLGINIAGPFPEGPCKIKIFIVAMDYFTKWIEAKAVATITGGQSNGLVERANQSLREGIKARLGEGNKNWVEKLPHVLWAHHTMIKSSHGDTPFSLTYGTEAVIPAEIRMPTYRTAAVDVVYNDEELRLNLDLLEERRKRAAIREAKAKLKMTKYYNARVRGVTFRPGDFVYRSNDASHAVA